ncbi:YncE family protein [Streptomyces goshikiensis]|uniref:YncE family protein n=1 Tax=Streptomyces goshikiensis TaxID=1942 RepID=UPI0036173431
MQELIRPGAEGDVLAVVSQSGADVSFFDAARHTPLGGVEVPAEPHELCFDPTRRLLWCTTSYRSGFYHANSGRRSELTVIDADTRRIAEVVDLAPEHAPHGLALDAARGLLYVSVEGGPDRSGGVVVIDTATRRPIGRIDTGAPGPHWFVVDATGTTGYASNKEAPFVSVVDLRLGKLTDRIEVPGSEGIAVSPDGSRVFVAAPYGSFAGREDGAGGRPANGVRIIDTARAGVTATLATEGLVFPVHHTATGRVLAGELRMAPDPGAPLGRHAPGRLTVFSGEGGERLGGIEVGLFPLTITSSPDGRTGYVACVVSSTVDVVDLESMRRLGRLEIGLRDGAGAHGLAYVPRA